MTVLNEFYKLFGNCFETKGADGVAWASDKHPVSCDKDAGTFSNLIKSNLSVAAITEAQAKADKISADADEYAKRITKETNERADKMIKDAQAKAKDIDIQMKKQIEIQQNILQKTRKEADEYRNRLLTAYKSHMDLIAKLPEMCENEYIRNTAAEVEKREAEKAKAAAAAKQAPKPAPVEEKPAAPAKPAPEAKTPVAAGNAPAEEPFQAMPHDTGKTAENDLPFFSSSQEKKPRHTDLQFGKGNTMK